ncbi:probable E3 ubiquitin-protein ligase RHY1A isoform X2 [Brachypodium distachyon]|uniref:probable E3 ubiquitin-protein ligase RHY1A isoform X2 n=1 Tax=Brachypodium distachyon TaxID=15368 RepID=UPI00052FFAB9|nr:probable E3 ubiquitin-protein ligase RHY1A isoform X2 [Brachypodium distachyon]|eukprot:XP_010235924.1 probable E3 ubiquitin-protein ligase RHY1A isoform X2 [Brachypodium distachyon]
MGLMAGMLPGVESARRRRLRPAAGSSAEAPCGGTRRPSSLCFYAASNGHEHHAHLGSAGFPKRNEEAWTTTLDSNAREAKERLDQKLRSQRESVVKRRHSTGSLRLPAASTSSDHRPAREPPAAAAASALQREVFSKKGDGRRFLWARRRHQQQEEEECAVCLEDFRAGDLLARLPCAHRFHWPCAVRWVRAASRCPVCRAAVRLAADPSPS